jgi:hypothetical protein
MLISIEKDFSFWAVINKALTLPLKDFFDYWILAPLSGVLLWFVNLPSLVIYIFAQIYSIYFHINYESYAWPYLSQTPSLSAYFLLGINITIMIYLILPGTVKIFTKRELRWWERGGRFSINTPCFIFINDQMIRAVLKDISYSGASIVTEVPINTNLPLSIDVEVLNKNYLLEGSIVRSITALQENVYGVRFNFQSFIQRLSLRIVIFKIGLYGSYARYR